MLGAASLVGMPGRRAEYIVGRKARQTICAKKSPSVRKKWEFNLAAYLLMWSGGKMKNTHFARKKKKKWKVNSKKMQNYPKNKK